MYHFLLLRPPLPFSPASLPSLPLSLPPLCLVLFLALCPVPSPRTCAPLAPHSNVFRWHMDLAVTQIRRKTIHKVPRHLSLLQSQSVWAPTLRPWIDLKRMHMLEPQMRSPSVNGPANPPQNAPACVQANKALRPVQLAKCRHLRTVLRTWHDYPLC